jgi:hypothetical protein
MNKMNSKSFSIEIEACVREEKISYMDAIIHLCEEKDLDPGKVNSFINKQIKEKIQVEAMNANMLKMEKGGKLPV